MPYKDREAQRAYQADWFQRRKDTKKQRAVRARAKNKFREQRRQWLRSLKEGHPCADCERTFHFAAMGWDHLPGTKKLFCISAHLSIGYSEQKILAEIAKCELVCANCHAIRTYERIHRLRSGTKLVSKTG